ncbi:MAG: bifunctional diaminohydroxyphosphoribosylaminopyrimidine deaminase/5-amino-6-(5-phosphoribosylamino)uracil reductase RibD [Candidatus Altiarchaeota archaeon]|nr:bifunctional diaminohydroxyphosphoribosylaminopyrimidine deaminase/5-amino-6-(5-phosphoribosylamino)uracil reductase RibD [Candidatus Altiarchaeota archaeon]
MKDEEYMRRALNISLQGNPSPNPYVGAVVVREGEIISEGYHKKAGMPHAETEALDKVDAMGATLYVTLEPCSHHGRTPPCTDKIIKSGIKKVVYGVDDPTEKVKGREALEAAGIEVVSGVLESECRRVNEVFFKYSTTGLPYVVLKAALTLDGQIATASGDSRWITCEKSREEVHRLRSRYDALLVGVNTVLRDDPMLTSRISGGRNPLRVVLDSTLRTPSDSRVLSDRNVLIATTKNHPVEKKKILVGKVEIMVFDSERVDLDELLKKLGKKGVTSVMVEGGSEVFTSFLAQNLVDKFHLFIAPKIMGGLNKPAFTGEGINSMKEVFNVEFTSVERIGCDIMVEAYPKK